MGPIRLPDCVWRPVHIVRAGAAVHMYVYETRRDVAIASIDNHVGGPTGAPLGDSNDLAVHTFDGATFEYLIREDDAASKGNVCRCHGKRIS